MKTLVLASKLFAEAAELWRQSRRSFLSDKAFRRYGFYLKPLTAYFQDVTLEAITAEMIRMYQQERRGKVSATVINHEVSCLQQMLRRIGRWGEIAGDYQPLPLPRSECGRALTDEEYTRMFRMASANPNWQSVFLFMALSVNTTLSPGEVLTLRLADADLASRMVRVSPEGSKNPERQRSIPLNAYAYEAAFQAVARAKKMGASAAEHYLFPFGSKGRIDPTRHQTTLKTAWKELCAAAGVQNFRLEDCRHHAITALLENPRVSEQTAEALAGHISARMKKRYAHIRIEYKRKAVAALAPPWHKTTIKSHREKA